MMKRSIKWRPAIVAVVVAAGAVAPALAGAASHRAHAASYHRQREPAASPSAHGGAKAAGRSEKHGGVGARAGIASGRGGLSVSPGILEHVASPGGVGAVTVTNTTGAAMSVKLALRPWLQSRGGEVSPNRRRVLREVRAEASSFSLAAGGSRTVELSLTRKPRNRSVYGGIEVTGAPNGRVKNGIKLDYRLVSSLRLNAPRRAQSYRARPGRLVEHGTVKRGMLLVAVRNTGNTIVPIGGHVRIGGHGHSLSATASATAIVPGHTVNVPLTPLSGSLPRGRYRVSVSLIQAGHRLGALHRTINLR
jgi:hypothetical protein